MKLSCAIIIKILCLTFLFTSCSKDEDKYIVSINVRELQLSSDAEEKEFKITSSGEWHIEADGLDWMYGGNAASTDWYTIAPASGTSDITVTVTLKDGITTSGKTSTLKIIGKNNIESLILKY